MFNKEVFIDNIRYLAKANNIKLGDLEDFSGVSVGYISRIEKTDSTPTIDFVEKVASKLDVSLDILMNYNLSAISEKDMYFARFIEKLLVDTASGKLYWNKEEYNYLTDNSKFLREDDNFSHPLFLEHKDSTGLKTTNRYNSLFHNPKNVEISADSFNCNISDEAKIYIMATSFFDDENAVDEFEIYLVEDNITINKLVNIPSNSRSQISKSILALYTAANESSKHVNISESAKNLIDSFMNN